MNPDEKYLNDPTFRTIVNVLRDQLRQANYTPSDLREAVMLACTMHEMEVVRPIMYGKVTWYPWEQK